MVILTDFDDAVGAEAAVDEGEIDAYYLIDPGMEAAAADRRGGVRHPDHRRCRLPDRDSDCGVDSRAVRCRIGRSNSRLPRRSVVGWPATPEVETWGEEAAAQGPSYQITTVDTEVRQLDATTYFSAGMAVFFLFFTVQFGVIGLLEEQRDGTMARLLAAPIRRTSVITAKALLSSWLGIISLVCSSWPPTTCWVPSGGRHLG